MPHILLRTSADLVENVDIPDILGALVATLSACETMESSAIKAYHELHSQWVMGDGAAPGFAAVQVTLAEGRTPQQLQAVGEALWAQLRESFVASIAANELNLTLELREFPKSHYWKA